MEDASWAEVTEDSTERRPLAGSCGRPDQKMTQAAGGNADGEVRGDGLRLLETNSTCAHPQLRAIRGKKGPF